MNNLSQQRCFNHRQREAAVRCPECGRFFCRECVTEHEDRMLCAHCLRDLAGYSEPTTALLSVPVRVLHFICGLIVAWFFFYYLAQVLLGLPSSFHEGTLWRGGW